MVGIKHKSISEIKICFGEAVKSRRRELGMSQEGLAERCDLSTKLIAGIEQGSRNITLMTIEKLALALDVPISTLFSEPSDDNP